MTNVNFSAQEPALGYLYQMRYALYLLLSSKQENNVKILIESLDDIELQIDDQSNLYQTKYHLKRETNLTDRSSDFWKTIRVWSEQITENLIDIDKTIFSLITTQKISTNSLMKDIKDKEDIANLLIHLNTIADETSNASNKQGYEAFKKLSSVNQQKLIENMHIIDSSLDFDEIDVKIKNELKLSALPNHIQPMFERLQGWFYNSCILHLQSKKDYISFEELQKVIYQIIDSFKEDNLPIDFPDKIIPTSSELEDVTMMTFQKQLTLVNISPRLKKAAISDYYRAYEQRSKWLKDDLLNPQEEINYDKRLIDDWERKFDLLLESTEESLEEEKKLKGNSFYKNFYVESIPKIFIRSRFQEAYLTIGSCHILANKFKIGWHPQYNQLLKVNNDT